MLRYIVLMVMLLAAVTAVPLEREKRQAGRVLSFGTRTSGETKLTSLLLNNEDILELNGPDTATVEINSLTNVTCDLDNMRVTIVGTSIVYDNIETCYVVTSLSLERLTSGVHNLAGPGTLYRDPDAVLFVDSASSVIDNFIESQRPLFPTPIPPLEILVVARTGATNELVLNLDNTGDPDNTGQPLDNSIILTGAVCRNISGTQSLVYSGNTLSILSGPNTREDIADIVQLDIVTEELFAGSIPCLALERSSESRPGFLQGSGHLCIGTSGLQPSETAAFFTNSDETVRSIREDIVSQLFRCDVNEEFAFLTGAFDDDVGVRFIEVSRAQSFSFPTATTVEHGGNSIVISDNFGIIQRLVCPTGNIALAVFLMNDIDSRSGSEASETFAVGQGGVTLQYNNCTALVYPSDFGPLEAQIAECRGQVPAPPPTDVEFSVEIINGQSVLVADGKNILTLSSSFSFPVARDQLLTFTGSSLQVDDGSGVVSMFTNINSLSVNIGNQLLTFTSSAAVGGPGTAFIDSMGRAFYTTDGGLASALQGAEFSSSAISVGLEEETGDVVLQQGNMAFFTVGPVTTTTSFSTGGAIIYNQNRILGLNSMTNSRAIMLLEGSSSSITMTDGGATFSYIDLNGNPVNLPLIASNIFAVETIGGSPMLITTNRTFTNGGLLITGDMGSIFLSTNVISDDSVGIMEGLALTSELVSDAEALSVFSNNRFGSFMGSSFEITFGPGVLFDSNNTYFYTNDVGTLERISNDVPRFRQVTSFYNSTTGNLVIRGCDETVEVMLPILSPRLQLPAGIEVTLDEDDGLSSAPAGTNDTFVISSAINRLALFDGIQCLDITTTTTLPATGGLLLVDESSERAFYATNPQFAAQVTSTIDNAFATFISPVILAPTTASITSKLSTVDASFGQIVRVSAGANVRLECSAGNANPPADFSFSVRTNLSSPDFTPLMADNSTVFFIENGPNNVTLLLLNVMEGEIEYRCDASNGVGGVQSASTRLIVGPREDPAIVNNFFIGRSSPGQLVVTVREPSMRQTFIPTLAPLPGTVIDDESQLVSQFVIGCKAEGRPKANITWLVAVGGGTPQAVNLSSPNFNVTVPRQGQSILTVRPDSMDTDCFVYSCVANNGGGDVTGEVEICPQRFDAEGTQVIEECSVTCGIGLRRITLLYLRSFNSMEMTVGFDDLPEGLVKPRVELCEPSPSTPCPVIDFVFEVEPFSNCSEFCTLGMQEREVTCFQTEDGILQMDVNDTECTSRGLVRPEETRSCNTNSFCPVYLADTTFGACSVTCGGGVMTREITCVSPTVDPDMGNVSYAPEDLIEEDIEFCRNFSRQVEPVSMQVCNEHPCPVRFEALPFGECDVFFCQTRNVSCVNFDPSDPNESWPAELEACLNQGLIPPHTVRDCGGRCCSLGNWRRTLDEPCNRVCGFGEETFTVECVDAGEVVEDGFCNSEQRPADVERCFVRNCPGRCDQEPGMCPLLRQFNLCKNPDFANIAQDCCISCPLQATPIPPIPMIILPPMNGTPPLNGTTP